MFTSSGKRNTVARFFDMLFSIWNYRKRLDLVLIDTYSTSAFYFASACGLLCKMLSIPYVPILHGGDLPLRLKVSKRSSHLLFDGSLINVAPSLYLKDAFEQFGYKVQYIPNFIPLEKYPFKLRTKVRPRLLYVRSFHKTYNPLLAIDVLKVLSVKYSDAALTMVGPDKDGSMQEARDKASQYGILDRLTITGRLSKDEWINLSPDFDIFINTTNYDNMPVSVLEAMSLGMPVVSTNVGGIPNLIDDRQNGFLVRPDSSTSFVDMISLLVEDADITKRISAGARQKAETFSWAKIRPLWEKLIYESFAK